MVKIPNRLMLRKSGYRLHLPPGIVKRFEVVVSYQPDV